MRCTGRVAHNAPVDQHTDASEPERFGPSTGVVSGWAGVVLAVAVLVFVAVGVHSVVGVRVGLGALFAAIVLWVTQLRPRLTAYPDVLLMRGCLRDTAVPFAVIDDVALGQTLNVWVGERRFVCIGIGATSRAGPEHELSYPALVLRKIRDRVAQARSQEDDEVPAIRQTYAVPEVLALVVTGLTFLVSLLV